jgi:gliding motility-associated-like protein
MRFALLLLFLFTLKVNAQQNLVYNGDFESYDVCPAGQSSPGDLQIEHCLGWTTPTFGTADYYNICAQAWALVSVPNNSLGWQNPYSGNGYCGFFAWSVSGGGAWWEYIRGRFEQPLIADHDYRISFYVALSGEPYAIDEIGLYISTDTIPREGSQGMPLPYTGITPQITSPPGVFITDTLNWTSITGLYHAIGGEKYLTIGNFHDTLTTDSFLANDYGGTVSLQSYYFVDGVSAVDVTDTTKNDTIPPNEPIIKAVIPNVLTPNNDGINDRLEFNWTGLVELTFRLFDRWGQEVIEFNKPGLKWDGTDSKGRKCSDGVYYYILNATFKNSSPINKKGFIHLFN